MYLKSLELQGFKSFPDKTLIRFGDDITAIVGPNGSGKSNISDAILWVMGEQSSRSLRGAKMEDVIFGGTEKRSQMGFAQVTLVIDNTENIFNMDESEVAITRRYYRSGESFCEQAYELSLISDWLEEAGFEVIGIYDDLTLDDVKQNSERAVFLAKKK